MEAALEGSSDLGEGSAVAGDDDGYVQCRNRLECLPGTFQAVRRIAQDNPEAMLPERIAGNEDALLLTVEHQCPSSWPGAATARHCRSPISTTSPGAIVPSKANRSACWPAQSIHNASVSHRSTSGASPIGTSVRLA